MFYVSTILRRTSLPKSWQHYRISFAKNSNYGVELGQFGQNNHTTCTSDIENIVQVRESSISNDDIFPHLFRGFHFLFSNNWFWCSSIFSYAFSHFLSFIIRTLCQVSYILIVEFKIWCTKLILFCINAEKSILIYNKCIHFLFKKNAMLSIVISIKLSFIWVPEVNCLHVIPSLSHEALSNLRTIFSSVNKINLHKNDWK